MDQPIDRGHRRRRSRWRLALIVPVVVLAQLAFIASPASATLGGLPLGNYDEIAPFGFYNRWCHWLGNQADVTGGDIDFAASNYSMVDPSGCTAAWTAYSNWLGIGVHVFWNGGWIQPTGCGSSHTAASNAYKQNNFTGGSCTFSTSTFPSGSYWSSCSSSDIYAAQGGAYESYISPGCALAWQAYY